jgi:hypothetical protein
MHSLFDDDDGHHFHRHSSATVDGWSQSHGQDSRLAYQPWLAKWILLTTTGAGEMSFFTSVGDPQLSCQATITWMTELAKPNCWSSGCCK